MVSLVVFGDKECVVAINNEIHAIIKKGAECERCYKYRNELTTNGTDDCQGNNIIALTLNKTKDQLAAITEDKKLLLWKWGPYKDKKLLGVVEIPKRPTSLTYCKTTNSVLVGDKNGDVYRCDYLKTEVEERAVLLLGHLSMLLDLTITSDDNYVVTADRDEKVRVSCYPNAYSVHSYCLGHTKMVSRIVLLSDEHLLSCSADSTVKLWEFKNGAEITSIDLLEHIPEKQDFYMVNKVLYDGSQNIFLIADSSKYLMHLEYNGATITHKQTLTLPSVPLFIFFNLNNILNVLLKSNENMVVKYSAQDSSMKEENEYTKMFERQSYEFGGIALPSFYTSLMKPCHLKRPYVITPESTINLESTARKKTKLDNEPSDTIVKE